MRLPSTEEKVPFLVVERESHISNLERFCLAHDGKRHPPRITQDVIEAG